ncbi:MAG: hypothetical protein ACRDDX_00450 [Cellulosilyticaceae bacterium]
MERRIRVHGEESDWYKEAVFVLRDEVTQAPSSLNLVHYAEELLEKQMKLRGPLSYYEAKQGSQNARANEASKRWIDYFFWGSIGLLGVVTCIYILL